MSFEQTQAYDDRLVTLLEALWGKGYLSPGGNDETRAVIGDVDLAGKDVLDIGSGTGGASLYLAAAMRPRSVTGIDVDASVVATANARAVAAGYAEVVRFLTVEPGPLPFPAQSFDIIFSKDAIVHIEDKQAIANEIARVLRLGGQLLASDWMAGRDGPISDELRHYIELEGLGFGVGSPDRYFAALRAAGFERICYRDRTEWYRQRALEEIAALDGPLRRQLESGVGRDFLEHELAVWRALAKVLASGELGPGHWRADSPSALTQGPLAG